MADDVNALGAGDPAGTDPNNVPGDLQDLKDKINAGSILRRLTQAQIDALSATQKPVGVVVHNSTAGRLQRWDGAKWVTLLDSATNPVISNTWPALLLDSTDGGPSQVAFLVGGAVRWMLYHRASSTGELVVDRYSSGGVYQGTPLAIAPSGAIAFQDAPAHPDAVADGESATLGQVTAAVNASASAAQSTANAALSNAAAAQSTANGATSAASAAQGTANNAVTKADAAQSTANNAVTKADAAQSTANTAASNADAAQSTANAALPKSMVIGGVANGTTDSSGVLSFSIPTSPTGNWSVVASHADTPGAPAATRFVSPQVFLPAGSTYVTCRVWSNAGVIGMTTVSIHWHAIAY